MSNNDEPKIIPNKPKHPQKDPQPTKPGIPRRIPDHSDPSKEKPIEVPPDRPKEVPVRGPKPDKIRTYLWNKVHLNN